MNNWKPNSSYSADDILAMQKDAIARVKEMQRRADETLRRSHAASAAPKPAHSTPQSVPPVQQTAPQPPAAPSTAGNSAASQLFSAADRLLTSSPPKGRLQGVLNALNIDNERLLILILLVLLYNDGADYTLLLALLYLLI